MVERIFMQVSVSKRESEMTLDNKDFDDRAQNYRRKKWIENGDDPDEMENKWKDVQKQKQKQRKKAQKEYFAKRKLEAETNETANAMQKDERFKNIATEKFVRKKKNVEAKKVAKNPLTINKKSKEIGNLKKDNRKTGKTKLRP